MNKQKKREEIYKEFLQVYPIEKVKNNIGEKARKVWNDMTLEAKVLTCIKLDKEGTIEKENDKYA